MIKKSQILIFESFCARASKISAFEFSKKWIFSWGSRLGNFDGRVRIMLRAQKIFRLIFYLERAHKIFGPRATLRACYNYWKIGHFFNLGTFSKNKTAKSPRGQHWGGERQNFLRKSREVRMKSVRSKSQLLIPKIEKVKEGVRCTPPLLWISQRGACIGSKNTRKMISGFSKKLPNGMSIFL